MILKISGVEYLVIKKNGLPYLIRRNDTLGKISNKVYGVPKHWPRIWKNNPELIQDPNKIYAGFTLYYEPLKTQIPLPQASGKLKSTLPAGTPRSPTNETAP